MTHTKRAFVGAALLCATGLAGAQTMYRCGNTFSQKPCGDSAAAVKVPGTEVTRSGSSPASLCAREIGASEGFEGAEAEVQNTRLEKSEVIQYAGESIAARRYTVFLKHRGAVSCYLSEDGQRVLKIGH